MRKSNGYWTLERCKEYALKYNTRKEFEKNSRSAYTIALKNKWMDIVCSHMNSQIAPRGYWNKETCDEFAKKCSSRTEFSKKFHKAYDAALRNHWLDDICTHMKEIIKSAGYWTDENLQLEAYKFKSKKDFKKYASGAYSIATKKGILDKLCSHMDCYGNRHNRLIYVYEFPDNHVYIGLTYYPRKRDIAHRTEGPVFNHSIKTEFNVPEQTLISSFMPAEDAAVLEHKTKEHYKKSGWIVLNIAKPGALGGNVHIWTKERCAEVAKKCYSRSEFKENFPSAYQSARKNRWLEQICLHMPYKINYRPKINP